MARVFITGSADGLGRNAAQELLDQGHTVVAHVRSELRRGAVRDLVDRGAELVIGDLGDLSEVRSVADQVNAFGHFDAVIHNAGVGVGSGGTLLTVNVVAPYLLTALINPDHRPERLIYLSSGMHRTGSTELDHLDWTGARQTASYSDSKLLLTALTMAVARLWPNTLANAVDPGWVPTRMGGENAPDDLRAGIATQTWLATSSDPEALVSGGYWRHRQQQDPRPEVHDTAFQDRLLTALADVTGTTLR
ncbi:SDR family NAD(P)-dependent oxidoreductase [Ammonicoccus fulvus]|uniref:SDR family NAD(P)-dependent oxidoreductase n=1 Tax=Ammonicoccus fulvus TaxID=3138240 RepID=A0ABZ3FN12_9ACTN